MFHGKINTRPVEWATACLAVGAALGLASCKSKETAGPAPAASEAPKSGAKAARAVAVKPATAERIRKELNPRGEPVYSGPEATIHGVIKVTGDVAPTLDDVLKQIEPKCAGARRVYGKLFREGPGRTLADVLVAVTAYEGFVPEKEEIETVIAKDCAFDARTIALTFGQTLNVQNKGDTAVIPELIGMKTQALVVALPGGDPVALLASRPGRFVLKDNTRPYAEAQVFVVRYPTTDVTGLDGRFEIPRVPVGKVRVSAYLPALGKTVEKEIEAKDGRNPELTFEIPFDAEKDTLKNTP